MKSYYERNKEKYKLRYLTKREELIKYQKDWVEKNYTHQMWISAKCRARKNKIPFKIKISDIIIPDCCPILGIPLIRKNIKGSPSLDRIIPELGYIKGNIQVISRLANTMKSNASCEELKLFANWVIKNIS